MTILRSRQIAAPKTTSLPPKTHPKSNPSTSPITPTSSSSSFSKPRNPYPNPNPKSDPSPTRRRSLRLTPEAMESKPGSGSDSATRLSAKGSSFDEGLGELGFESKEKKKRRRLEIDINISPPNSECEAAAEEEEEGGVGSRSFLSLRSGKKVAKIGTDSSNGDLGSEKSEKNEVRADVATVLDFSDEGNENVGVSSAKGKEKMESSSVLEISEEEMSLRDSKRKFSREEKGKEKLDSSSWSFNHIVELDLLSSMSNVVASDVNVAENNVAALQEEGPEEEEVRNPNVRVEEAEGRDRNRYMERFRDIARQNASRFARFDPREDEEENHIPPLVDAEPDIDDWPGPFATAMRIMRAGAEKNAQEQSGVKPKAKPSLVKWVPRPEGQGLAMSRSLIPSLQELCLSVLAKNAEAIASLESVPDSLRHQLSHMLCDSRRMNSHFLELLVQRSPTEVRLRDCSWLTEEEFTKYFTRCDFTNLTVLQLDQCGRCLPDYILNSTLARSANRLPALVSLSLSGACRLSDVGLAALVSSVPALRSLNLSQCSLLSSSSIDILANSLGSVLKELYLNDCQSIDAMLILPALKKFEQLEVLWLPGIENVCDDFIKDFIPARGHNLKELVLTDCIHLTDSSVKVIAETCSGLSTLDLFNLHKLTDYSLGYLAHGCRAIQTLKFCRNSFSDEAIAAFLETSGECLKELSLNNVKKVGENTAISLARHSRNVHCLDLSWCRNLTDQALGLIVDSCLSLKMLKLFGCTQITDLFLSGHSNPDVKIVGVRMSPILKDVRLSDPAAGPLHYSSV